MGSVHKLPAIDLDAYSAEDTHEIARIMLGLEGVELTECGQFDEFCRQAWVILEPQTKLARNWYLSAVPCYLGFRHIGI